MPQKPAPPIPRSATQKHTTIDNEPTYEQPNNHNSCCSSHKLDNEREDNFILKDVDMNLSDVLVEANRWLSISTPHQPLDTLTKDDYLLPKSKIQPDKDKNSSCSLIDNELYKPEHS